MMMPAMAYVITFLAAPARSGAPYDVSRNMPATTMNRSERPPVTEMMVAAMPGSRRLFT